MGRINILLIDDHPASFYGEDDVVLDPPFDEWFCLHWIHEARQGRWLLNACDMLAGAYPHELFALGLPPEIIVFDYHFHMVMPRNDEDSSNIVSRVHGLIADLELPAAPVDEDDYPSTPQSSEGHNRDGCYLGVEFARSFGWYPCGAVPTSAGSRTEGTDAEFYEWLNSEFFHDMFDPDVRIRPNPTWEHLIVSGVKMLRERVSKLTISGSVRQPLTQLRELAKNPQQMVDSELLLSCNYGQRRLPVRGIFADYLLVDPVDASQFRDEASEWASKILDGLADMPFSKVMEAQELALEYFDKGRSDESEGRYHLSEVVGDVCRSTTLLDEIATKTARLEFREQQWQEASKAWRKRLAAAKGNEEKMKGVVKARTELERDRLDLNRKADKLRRKKQKIDRRGTELRDLCEAYGLVYDDVVNAPEVREMTMPEIACCVPPIWAAANAHETGRLAFLFLCVCVEQFTRNELERRASIDDVLRFSDPFPEKLTTFLQSKANLSKDTVTLEQPLKRLGGQLNGGWGQQGVKLSDIIENRSKVLGTHGLRPGEGRLLRSFADDIGLENPPTWLRDAI